MKTKLDLAHDYALSLNNANVELQFDKFINLCWGYADAMYEQLEKRETKGVPKAISSACSDWHPDWSQAPEWADWWAITRLGQGHWFLSKPKVTKESWVRSSRACRTAPSFNYQGLWQDSLRKRPEVL